MKRRILLLLVAMMVIPTIASGGMTVVKKKSSADSCTGGLLFSAHFENNDDVTVGTPAGCSAGDSSATLTTGATYSNSANEYYDGSYGVELNGATNAGANFDVTTQDIVSGTAGRVDFWMRIASWSDWDYVWSAYADSSRYISIQLRDTNELRARYRGTADVYIDTTTMDIPTTTWVHVIFRWRTNTGDVNPELSITVDATTETLDQSALTGGVTPTSMSIGGAAADLVEPITGQIDSFKVYNSYE